VVLLLHHLLGQDARAEQDVLQRIEQLTQETDAATECATHGEGVLAAVDLGHDLAEEEQEEREQDGDDEELEPDGITEVDGMADEIVAEHDDGHVHQVVGDEDRGQQSLGILTKCEDVAVALRVALLQLVDIIGCQ